MNRQEIEKHIRENERKIKTIIKAYKAKNRSGYKTKGLSKKTAILLMEFINLYPLNDATMVFSLSRKTNNDNDFNNLIKRSFKEDDSKRIIVFIDKKAKWGRILFGESINNRITEDKRLKIESTFTKNVNKNHILKGAEKLTLEIQSNLLDA